MLGGRYSLFRWRQHAVQWNLTAWRTIVAMKGHNLFVLAPDQPFFWADVAANQEFGCAGARFQIEPPRPRNPCGPPPQLPPGRAQKHLAATLSLQWHEAAANANIPGAGISLASLSRVRPTFLPSHSRTRLVPERSEERNVRRFGFLLSEGDCRNPSDSDIPPMKGHAVLKRGRQTRGRTGFAPRQWKLAGNSGFRV